MKKTTILVLLVLALCLGSAAAEKTEVLGQPFPDFTVTDTQGNVFTLSEALKDHEAALVNIWATWCPPCEAEMPYLNEAYELYGDKVAFIALSCEPKDTMEIIEEYRQAHGLAFPMGRDENSSLIQYIGSTGIPTTVIVDRFGNATFSHVGSFMSTGEVKRVIEAFLGDGYTETTVLTEIPKDAATRSFPVSGATAIRVENETAKRVAYRAEGIPEAVEAYVIEGDAARLRLEAAAADSPTDMLCYDYMQDSFFELMDLLDPQRGAYVYDSPMPGAQEDMHYTYVCLLDGNSGEILDDIYLIAGEDNIEEMADDLRARGYTVSWEYIEAAPAEDAAPQAYILHIIDQEGAPVPDVMVNFCSDTACTMLQSDEDGKIIFDGEPGAYHIQLLKAPEGYSFDPGFEAYTGVNYGEWALRIRKN